MDFQEKGLFDHLVQLFKTNYMQQLMPLHIIKFHGVVRGLKYIPI
jgi:hypothetical protein